MHADEIDNNYQCVCDMKAAFLKWHSFISGLIHDSVHLEKKVKRQTSMPEIIWNRDYISKLTKKQKKLKQENFIEKKLK